MCCRLPSNGIVKTQDVRTFHEMYSFTKTMAKMADLVKLLFPP